MFARRNFASLTLAPLAALALTIAIPTMARATPCPNVMFVLDQSGSMADPPTNRGSTSKWDLLVGAVQTVLGKYGDQLSFGLELFTDETTCLFNCTDQQCYADTRINISPAHDTAAAIMDKLNNSGPSGGTNTGYAIRRAVNALNMDTSGRGQYIILITDGDPTTCSASEPQYTYDWIQKGTQVQPVPIHTFVIGFDGSNGVRPDYLAKMAQLGDEPKEGCNASQPNTCYYSASSAQELNDALDKILTVVSGGEFGGEMTCDDSCLSTGCPVGQVCKESEFGMPACQPDPCHGAICDGNTYCRDGACIAPCPACGPGKYCKNGACLTDICVGVTCTGGQVCDPNTGACVANQCNNCVAGQYCDVDKGCVTDPCQYIACPSGTTCKLGGNCEAKSTDGNGNGSGNGGGGGRTRGGCALGGGEPGGLAALFGLGLLGLALRRRRVAS